MMSARPRIRRVIFTLVMMWILAQVGILAVNGAIIKQTVRSRNISQIVSNVHRLQTLSKWQAWFSLGLVYLPPFKHPYRTYVSILTTAGTGAGWLQSTKDMAIAGLRGNEQPWEAIEQRFDQLQPLQTQLQETLQLMQHQQVRRIAKLLNLDSRLDAAVSQGVALDSFLSSILPLKQPLRTILGYDRPQHVVVLTQNNMELWPTGGYLGSYIEFYLDRGALKELQFQDIGVPNGQIKGYVKAPAPISMYTHLGNTPGWRLRESNWNPDFPDGLKTIDWFFTEGKVKPIDHLVAVNLIPVIDTLRMLGPVYLSDYDITLTGENFYHETQQRTSFNFFDGSTQKRDYLSALGKQLLWKIMDKPEELAPEILRVAARNLANKQILISTKNPELASFLRERNWDGSIPGVACPKDSPNCRADFLHINETNVGINKTNCCIERKFIHSIELLDSVTRHTLTISYVNHNRPKPEPPAVWGGGYKVYHRLYTPARTRLVNISSSGQAAEPGEIDRETYEDKQVFGFLGLVEGGQTGEYTVVYEVPVTTGGAYQLRLIKQSGIDTIPWQISIHKGDMVKQFNLSLQRDQWISE